MIGTVYTQQNRPNPKREDLYGVVLIIYLISKLLSIGAAVGLAISFFLPKRYQRRIRMICATPIVLAASTRGLLEIDLKLTKEQRTS